MGGSQNLGYLSWGGHKILGTFYGRNTKYRVWGDKKIPIRQNGGGGRKIPGPLDRGITKFHW